MKSSTKVLLDSSAVLALCAAAGFPDAGNVSPLGAGEFNAVYAFEAAGRRYALKIAPDSRAPVMTYERSMMQSEVFWYEQLRSHTAIAVPEISHADFSRALLPSDFFIMELVPGKQMNEMDFTSAEKESATEKLPEMAAQIHRIANRGYGYPQCGLHDTWPQALYAMVRAIVSDAAAMGKPCENGEKLLSLVQRHREVLSRAECRMVNFDLWEANILCDRREDGMHYTWIDPERGFWGDPLMDFICFEFDKPLFAKRASLSAYNAVAETPVVPGREAEIRFAFAQAYLGLIMEVERYYRYTPEDEGWKRNDMVCGFLFEKAFGCLEGE